MLIDGFPAQIARTQRFMLGVPRAFTLSSDGCRLLFVRSRGAEDPVGCLWLHRDGVERLLVDPLELGAGPGEVPPEELIRRERARERSSGVVGYATDAEVRTVVLALDGRLWTVSAGCEDAAAPRPVSTAGPVVDPRIDPTGRRVAYVTGGALHVIELVDAAEAGAGPGPGPAVDRLLAEPETPDVTWGLAEHVAGESMHRQRGHWWSPDGTRLLVARVDVAGVERWWVSDPAHPAKKPRQVPYPVAGTANAEVSLYVFDLAGGRVEVDWDRAGFEYLATAGWDRHGILLSVQSRDQRTLHVLAADPDTGAVTLLHEQRDDAWVQLIGGTPARTASGALVHTEDSTYGPEDRTYGLEDGTRRLLVGGRAVTPDGLQVRRVLEVSGESVLFTAGDEPTEEHLWSYDPQDGLVRLSEGPGLHTGTRAESALLLNSFTEDGREVRLLDIADGTHRHVRTLDAEPLVQPRITWLRAGERQLRTALLLPSWYEAGRYRLPVLLAPYGGPAALMAVRARTAVLCEAQWFAEHGFAIVIADGRGTPGRGPAWEKTVYGDTLGAPLEDQVVALHAAAEHCPDLDLGRVGIKGWSFGGMLAAAAVLRRPEVFHAAISGAGPSEARLYDTHWRERFLGLPQDHPEAYDRSSTIGDAPNLSRPLLLIHGLADDNVVPAHTLRLSSALLAAGRPHQVLPLAGTHMPTQAETVGLLLHELEFLCQALGVAGASPRVAVGVNSANAVGGGTEGER